MIISLKPLTLAEVQEMTKDMDEKKNLTAYLKKNNKVSSEKAQEIVDKIMKMQNHKIKLDHAVKIADFMPADAEALHKIFDDVSLSEGEINAILEIVKQN